MGLFSKVFGIPKEIEFVKETNKRLHEIIHDFLILEEINKEEITLAEAFLKKSDAETLKELIVCIHKRTIIQEGRINDLKTILETEHEELKSMMIASNLEDKKNEQTFEEEIIQIETTLELDEEDQRRIILFAKKYHGDDVSESLHVLINNRDEINNVIKIIYKQAKILQQDKELLKKLEAQLPKIDRGLVNNLLKKIVDEIINSNILQEIYKIKEAKFHLEEHALKEKVDNQVSYYKNKIINGKEPELLEQVLNYKPRIKRILVILKKLLTKEQYEVHHGKIEQVITILEFIFKKRLLNKLIKLSKKQIAVLEKDDLEKFLTYYQQEKVLSIHFSNYLHNLGAKQLLEGTIKALINIQTKIRSINVILAIAAVFAVVINLPNAENIHLDLAETFGLGVSSVNLAGFPFFSVLSKLGKLKEEKIVSKLEKESQKLTPNVKNKAKQIENEYGFRIRGKYHYGSLTKLIEALEYYHPFETKKILKTIFFLDTAAYKLLAGRDSGGLFKARTKSIYLFTDTDRTTIKHELAHARHYGLDKRFGKLWKSENNKGMFYMMARTKIDESIKPVGWEDTKGTEPRYGYIKPYGTTNWHEDLATMVEYIHEEPLGKMGDLRNPKYQQIYLAKAYLLLKGGLIDQSQYLRFKRRVLNLFNQNSNSNNYGLPD